MPIRFQCPECQSKLKIGSHKAGSRKSCPYCHVEFVVPAVGEAEMPVAKRYVDVQRGAGTGTVHLQERETKPAQGSTAPIAEPTRPDPKAISTPVVSEPLAPPTSSRATEAAPKLTGGTVAVPRRVIYVMGGLLTVVALFFFLFGVMTGRRLAPRRTPVLPPSTEKCVISGTVLMRRDNQRVPDADSIVIFMPVDATPDIRPEAESLHPDQQSASDSPDAQLIRTFGGEVARVDGSGRFRVVLVSGKSYDMLVISKSSEDEEALPRELRANWGRVFVPLEPVIGDQARFATQFQARGTTQTLPPVVFE